MGSKHNCITSGIKISCSKKISVHYAGILVISNQKITQKIIEAANKSCYNNKKTIFTHKIKTEWNILKNNTRKLQTVDKISETKLGIGNTEDAEEIACVFDKFLLLTAETLYANHSNLQMAIQ